MPIEVAYIGVPAYTCPRCRYRLMVRPCPVCIARRARSMEGVDGDDGAETDFRPELTTEERGRLIDVRLGLVDASQRMKNRLRLRR